VQNREELIFNVIVFFCGGLGRAMYRGTDTEYYCFCWRGLAEGNIEMLWKTKINFF